MVFILPNNKNTRTIFRTQDDGQSWDTIPAPDQYCYDVYSFEDRLYAMCNSKFYRKSLTNNDWTVVSPSFPSGQYPLNMFVSDSLLFFATPNNIWCSSNYGGTWTKTIIPFHNSFDNFCKIGNRVYKGGGLYKIMFTDDFGHSWQDLPIPDEFIPYDFVTVAGQLLCGTVDQGVLRYDVTNQRLLAANKGLNSAEVKDMDLTSGHLWAACGSGVFSYDLTQNIWVNSALLPLPKNYYDCVAVSPSGKIVAKEKYGTIFYLSVDGGASWKSITTSEINFLLLDSGKLFWLGENILISGHSGTAFSKDLGKTWEIGGHPFEIVFFAGKYFGISTFGNLVSSTDFGQTWQQENGPAVSSMRALFATDDKLFTLSYKQSK